MSWRELNQELKREYIECKYCPSYIFRAYIEHHEFIKLECIHCKNTVLIVPFKFSINDILEEDK